MEVDEGNRVSLLTASIVSNIQFDACTEPEMEEVERYEMPPHPVASELDYSVKASPDIGHKTPRRQAGFLSYWHCHSLPRRQFALK